INSSRSLFGKKLFGLLCLARFIDLAKNQPLMCHFKVRLPWAIARPHTQKIGTTAGLPSLVSPSMFIL
ncbi:MAG: hypothetical protein PUP93_34375, partial [Rhizonema sp. NSF051]|nr:hypothetical protein [Rhizonema sp. NSF051]